MQKIHQSPMFTRPRPPRRLAVPPHGTPHPSSSRSSDRFYPPEDAFTERYCGEGVPDWLLPSLGAAKRSSGSSRVARARSSFSEPVFSRAGRSPKTKDLSEGGKDLASYIFFCMGFFLSFFIFFQARWDDGSNPFGFGFRGRIVDPVFFWSG